MRRRTGGGRSCERTILILRDATTIVVVCSKGVALHRSLFIQFEDVVSFKHAYIYHPIGTKWAVTTTNPTRTQLETATNWSKVYDTKNIGIVRATVTSPLD